MKMGNETKTSVNWQEVADAELSARFAEICAANGTRAEEVISAFIKDYVVSSGHPETVVGRWPWNKRPAR